MMFWSFVQIYKGLFFSWAWDRVPGFQPGSLLSLAPRAHAVAAAAPSPHPSAAPSPGHTWEVHYVCCPELRLAPWEGPLHCGAAPGHLWPVTCGRPFDSLPRESGCAPMGGSSGPPGREDLCAHCRGPAVCVLVLAWERGWNTPGLWTLSFPGMGAAKLDIYWSLAVHGALLGTPRPGFPDTGASQSLRIFSRHRQVWKRGQRGQFHKSDVWVWRTIWPVYSEVISCPIHFKLLCLFSNEVVLIVWFFLLATSEVGNPRLFHPLLKSKKQKKKKKKGCANLLIPEAQFSSSWNLARV